MKRPKHQLNKNSSLTAKLILMTLLMTSASSATAEESNVAYVDSVLKWGAWELDIEPAAGGLSAPTTKALNPRGSKVSLRTNSIAALAPPGKPERPIKPGIPTTPPVTPPPAVPTLTPISPSVPIPVGGPGGSPTPAPTLTTISPNVPIPVGGPGGIPGGGPGT